MTEEEQNEVMIEAEKESYRRMISDGTALRKQMIQSDSEILKAAIAVIYKNALNQIKNEEFRTLTVHTAGNLMSIAAILEEGH